MSTPREQRTKAKIFIAGASRDAQLLTITGTEASMWMTLSRLFEYLLVKNYDGTTKTTYIRSTGLRKVWVIIEIIICRKWEFQWLKTVFQQRLLSCFS